MINEGDESLMNPSSMRGEVSRSRAWGMLAVMNSSVADTKRYNSLYEATDEMNGNLVIVQAKAGRMGFEKQFNLTNPKEKEEYDKIMEDIGKWGFVEVKKVVDDDQFFY